MTKMVEVVVTKTLGSAPRDEGTSMLVGSQASCGTIGGGHLEFKAIEIARELLDGDTTENTIVTKRFTLGASLGQCCGGVVELEFSPREIKDSAQNNYANKLYPVYVFGAGHVGRALLAQLSLLPCRVIWVDSRAAEFDKYSLAIPEKVTKIITEEPEEIAEKAQPGAAFVVLTHSHALDFMLCEKILKKNDYTYLGVIGSKSKSARFRKRLYRKGLVAYEFHCPIGTPEVEGKEPEIVGLSIASQLMGYRKKWQKQSSLEDNTATVQIMRKAK